MSVRRSLALALAAGALVASALPAAAAVPNTTITSGPSGLIKTRSVTFRFKASVSGATFQCKMDGKSWSSCASPKKYSRLAQGPHTFRVRAIKNGVVEQTPAVRRFKVDSIKPNTTILTGPSGVIEDHIVTFTFSSTEPGTFLCKLTSVFEPCSSPHVVEPVHDGSYVFAVKARDLAGNADPTPATRAFSVETPVTRSMSTAATAADMWFPLQVDIDVPTSCGGAPEIDCPNGTPTPPADQLRVASTVTNITLVSPNRYDVTVESNITTLQPIVVEGFGLTCEMEIVTAPGAHPAWRVLVPIHFQTDPTSGDLEVVAGSWVVNNVEDDDFSVEGENFFCAGADWSVIQSALADSFPDWMIGRIGSPLCAAPGPAYLAACPEP